MELEAEEVRGTTVSKDARLQNNLQILGDIKRPYYEIWGQGGRTGLFWEERMKRRCTKHMETRDSDIQELSPSYSNDESCSWSISGFPRCHHTKNVTFWSRILDDKSETKGRRFTRRLKHLFNCRHNNLSSTFLPACEQRCPMWKTAPKPVFLRC